MVVAVKVVRTVAKIRAIQHVVQHVIITALDASHLAKMAVIRVLGVKTHAQTVVITVARPLVKHLLGG